MVKAIKSYVKDENALDEQVGKILFIVVCIGVVMAIGWFVWNMLSDKANNAANQADGNRNPGAGSEFSGNPFGN